MPFDPITTALDLGNKLIDRLWPNPAERDAAKLKLFELQQNGELQRLAAETQLAQAQADIDKIEAASENRIKSMWRPSLGWVCVASFALNFFLFPLVSGLAALFGHPVNLPELDVATFMPVLLGMLGLGAYRTYEKTKNGKE